jgi:hypothetical protein
MADSFLHLPVEDRREALGLVGDDGEALPKTRREEKRWTSEVHKRSDSSNLERDRFRKCS